MDNVTVITIPNNWSWMLEHKDRKPLTQEEVTQFFNKFREGFSLDPTMDEIATWDSLASFIKAGNLQFISLCFHKEEGTMTYVFGTPATEEEFNNFLNNWDEEADHSGIFGEMLEINGRRSISYTVG